MEFYNILLFSHSWIRWLVVGSLLIAIARAGYQYRHKRSFTPLDNQLRVAAVTISHLQLTIGVLLYIKSPLIQHFFANFSESIQQMGFAYFGIYHILMMTSAVVVITIGSAKAKRWEAATAKHRTLLIWFTIGFLIILAAIPWPFIYGVHRPFFRPF